MHACEHAPNDVIIEGEMKAGSRCQFIHNVERFMLFTPSMKT